MQPDPYAANNTSPTHESTEASISTIEEIRRSIGDTAFLPM
jgi:hypothetical protein